MGKYFWENDGVFLRNLKEKDVETLTEAMSERAFRFFIENGESLPVSEEDMLLLAEVANEEMDMHKHIYLAITDEADAIKGYITLNSQDDKNGTIMMQIVVFPAFQRNGFARKACEIILSYAFFEKRLHKVICKTMAENSGGCSFLESMGFFAECLKQDMFFSHGKYFSEVTYGLLVNDYRDKNKKEKQKPAGKAQMKTKEAVPNIWQDDKIRIRALTEEDCSYHEEILMDADTCRFYNHEVSLPYYEEELSEFECEHLYFGGDDNRLVFVIEDLEADYIGTVHLFGLDYKQGRFSYSIFVRECMQKKGYATRALRLVLNYAFSELRMHKCVATVLEGNLSSEQVMKKIGFQKEGVMRGQVYYNGNYVNELHYGITKERFQADNT